MGNIYLKSTWGCIYCGTRTRAGELLCASCKRREQTGFKKGQNEHDIALLNGAARSLGLSYGQGVARYGARGLLEAAGYIERARARRPRTEA